MLAAAAEASAGAALRGRRQSDQVSHMFMCSGTPSVLWDPPPPPPPPRSVHMQRSLQQAAHKNLKRCDDSRGM